MDEPKGGLSVDYQGNVWIADTQHNRIVRLSPTGEVLVDKTDILNPVSPSVNPKDGSVWVAGNNTTLINLSPTGTKVKEFEVGGAIVAVTFSPADGGIWIADMLGASFTGQVSKWTANGEMRFANAIPQPSTVSIGFWQGN
jgi:streptogramin lyase